MSFFPYRGSQAYAEEIPLENLAESFGTPLYVYSKSALKEACRKFKDAFSPHPTFFCYAVKANSSLAVLREIFGQGYGADIVSMGELERALIAGCPPHLTVFSGVGKRDDEISRAIEAGILSFNVESFDELERIAKVAKITNRVQRVALRINPNIDARTNPYITTGLTSTKFGIAETELPHFISRIKGEPSLRLSGVACHLGSQVIDLDPLEKAAERLCVLGKSLRKDGFPLEWVDLGGGLGIRYRDEKAPPFSAYASTLLEKVAPSGFRLILEPGRCLVAEAGILLTRVISLKAIEGKNFVVTDAAMNDLPRPSLYKAYHEIFPVTEKAGDQITYDVVGPICETADFLGKGRVFRKIEANDLLYVQNCGAYASSMASNYNSRPRAAEVLVHKKEVSLIRERETLSSLWALERLEPSSETK